MTNKIVWRLPNRPTPKEVTDLLGAGILTKDEAREILFNLETDEDRDKKSLQDEITFLRKLVQNLSTNKQVIVETIREVQVPYKQSPWVQPYINWCSTTANASNSITYTGGSSSNLLMNDSTTGVSWITADSSEPMGFTEIKTF